MQMWNPSLVRCIRNAMCRSGPFVAAQPICKCMAVHTCLALLIRPAGNPSSCKAAWNAKLCSSEASLYHDASLGAPLPMDMFACCQGCSAAGRLNALIGHVGILTQKLAAAVALAAACTVSAGMSSCTANPGRSTCGCRGITRPLLAYCFAQLACCASLRCCVLCCSWCACCTWCWCYWGQVTCCFTESMFSLLASEPAARGCAPLRLVAV